VPDLLYWLAVGGFALAIVALAPVVWQAAMDYLWYWPFWATVSKGGVSVGGSEVAADVAILSLTGRTAYFDVMFALSDGSLYWPSRRVEMNSGRSVREGMITLNPHDRIDLHIAAPTLPLNTIAGKQYSGVALFTPGHPARWRNTKGYRLYQWGSKAPRIPLEAD
jgi:hypothetical protein